MPDKKPQEKIWELIQQYKMKNRGASPRYLLLDPENLYQLQMSLDKDRKTSVLWYEYAESRTLYGLPIFVRHHWDKSIPNILEVI